jgi:hypothetical protein
MAPQNQEDGKGGAAAKKQQGIDWPGCFMILRCWTSCGAQNSKSVRSTVRYHGAA